MKQSYTGLNDMRLINYDFLFMGTIPLKSSKEPDKTQWLEMHFPRQSEIWLTKLSPLLSFLSAINHPFISPICSHGHSITTRGLGVNWSQLKCAIINYTCTLSTSTTHLWLVMDDNMDRTITIVYATCITMSHHHQATYTINTF